MLPLEVHVPDDEVMWRDVALTSKNVLTDVIFKRLNCKVKRFRFRGDSPEDYCYGLVIGDKKAEGSNSKGKEKAESSHSKQKEEAEAEAEDYCYEIVIGEKAEGSTCKEKEEDEVPKEEGEGSNSEQIN